LESPHTPQNVTHITHALTSLCTMKMLVATVLLGLLVVTCSARPSEMKVKRQLSRECSYQLWECHNNIDHSARNHSFSDFCHVQQQVHQCSVTVYSSSECYDQQRLSKSQQLLQLVNRHCAEHADVYAANWHCFTDEESSNNVHNCLRSNIFGRTCSVDDFVDCVGTAYNPSCSAEFVQAEQDVYREWLNIDQFCSSQVDALQDNGDEELNLECMLMKNRFV